jgi:hypothetical protein
MPDPFSSANAKLQRATETGNILEHEIHAFLEENPNPYQIVGELRNRREYVFTAFGELQVPLRFSLLFGEVVYQLRTSLDHLLAALVTANASTPTDKHQFPIASTPAKFKEAVKRGDIAGVSRPAMALIEGFQPYQREQPKPSLLNLLREWNNADKHRLLVFVGGAIRLGERITVDESDGPFSIVGMSPARVKRVTSSGADVVTISLGEEHAVFRARGEFQPTVVIENLEGLEAATVSEVLTKTVGFIRHLFSVFQSHISASAG